MVDLFDLFFIKVAEDLKLQMLFSSNLLNCGFHTLNPNKILVHSTLGIKRSGVGRFSDTMQIKYSKGFRSEFLSKVVSGSIYWI